MAQNLKPIKLLNGIPQQFGTGDSVDIAFLPIGTTNASVALGSHNHDTVYANLTGPGGTVPTSQLPASVLGALDYQGTWNATTNVCSNTSAALASASTSNKGFYFIVATAGTTSVNLGPNNVANTDWQVGDWIVSDGTYWDRIANTSHGINASTDISTGTVSISHGGTGASTASDALVALGIPSTSVVLTIGESISAGQLVYIDGSSLVWRATNTSAANGLKQAIGFAVTSGTVVGTDTVTVYLNGINSFCTALVPGGRCYLGAAGTGAGIVQTVPTGAGVTVQHVGTAITATSLAFVCGEGMLLS